MVWKKSELEGLVFGRLTVIEEAGRNKRRKVIWLCRCICGEEKVFSSAELNSGLSNSCGCLKREKLREKSKTHGYSNSRLYVIWHGMKQRCHYEKHKGYSNYGGRGIKIVERWKDFDNFHEWAMENGYEERLTIERKDVNGNYEPENCKWIPMKQQYRNRTDTHFITYKDKTKSLAEWSEILEINYSVLQKRIQNGWSIERAFTQPVRRILKQTIERMERRMNGNDAS